MDRKYRCDLCLVDVPCQATLDIHTRGKNHIKREKQLQEQRKEIVDVIEIEGFGFKTGTSEMAKLNQTEREELEESRKMIKILQKQVKDNNEKLALCRKEHGMSKVELEKKIEWCHKTHPRSGHFIEETSQEFLEEITSDGYLLLSLM